MPVVDPGDWSIELARRLGSAPLMIDTSHNALERNSRTLRKQPVEVSAIQCRVQEAYHRDRAAHADLENVRKISEKAAMVWGKEAVWAELREAKKHHRLTAGAISSAQEVTDRVMSENPDRGFADP